MRLLISRKGAHPVRPLRRLPRQVARSRRTIYGLAGAMMVMQTKQRMAEDIAPDGRPWVPLSPRTIAAKGHAKPLFHTGDLNRSIQVISLSSEGVGVGPTMGAQQKGIAMQFGKEHVPARPFLGWAPDSPRGRRDLQQITDLVASEIRKRDGV